MVLNFSIECILGLSSAINKRRRRCSFSAWQVHVLETEFNRHRYISTERRNTLAALLNLTPHQIKNRRYKSKRRCMNE